MEFKPIHNNYNVYDLQKSISFYEDALGLREIRRITPEDGSFLIVYLGNDPNGHLVELTWLRDRATPYQLGDNEIHLAFSTGDFAAAREKHRAMGVICYENEQMGIYFISDPDGYWIEIVPES